MIDVARIRARRFHVALDCVRGAGGTAIPPLLEALGCRVSGINLETDGRFPRAPEPVPENLGELSRPGAASPAPTSAWRWTRTWIVWRWWTSTGEPIGEDYTLAFAVRAVLDGAAQGRRRPPVVVANLSTSLVVEDAARAGGARFLRAPVGEANVARTIRDEGAVIGGEGNGGVILPGASHRAGRPSGGGPDLASSCGDGVDAVGARRGLAPLHIVKAKAPRGADLAPAYEALRKRFADADGRRPRWTAAFAGRIAGFTSGPSGTEPIVRFIAEAPTAGRSRYLIEAARELLSDLRDLARCAASSATSDPGRRRRCSSRGCGGWSTAGTTPRASRSSTARASGHKAAGKLAALEQQLTGQIPDGHRRHRAHPLGHPRRPHDPQRPPPHRPVRAHRRHPQRHHRELRRHPEGAPDARAHLQVRNRHRGAGPSRRRVLPGQPGGGGGGGAPGRGRRLRHRGHLGRRAGRAGRGPEGLAAPRRRRRERVVRRLRRLAPARAHPLGRLPRRRRDGGAHPRRLPGAQPRDHAHRQAGQPDRLGPRDGRARRLRALHAQGDLRAARESLQHAPRPPARGRGHGPRRRPQPDRR